MQNHSETSAGNDGMLRSERIATVSLGLIYAIRMLGLFMLLPVVALYTEQLTGATPLLIGLAVGIYGLSQAALQIPFGALSDRFGRKPVITVGLLIFAAGSVVAAEAETAMGLVLGRTLQGAGAIAAAVIALAADVTRDSQRSKIMAVIGLSIGATFIASLILGPMLYGLLGGSGLFYLTAALALVALAVLWAIVPAPLLVDLPAKSDKRKPAWLPVLLDSQLLRLNSGILLLHFMLTAGFIAMPYYLRDSFNLPVSQHWLVYLAVMLVALLIMMPALFYTEKTGRIKTTFLIAIAVMAVAQLAMSDLGNNWFGFASVAVLYFAGFNLLEALLPSLISRLAPSDQKGAALGVYSSCQFFGAFLGGALGGWVLARFGYPGIMILGSIIAGIWLIIAAGMSQFSVLQTYLLKLAARSHGSAQALAGELVQIRGVKDVQIDEIEGIARLKVDYRILDTAALEKYAA